MAAPRVAPPGASFVLELLEQLDAAGIRYCVLRNCDQLAQGRSGGDVDIQVENSAAGTIVRIADRVAADYGASRIVLMRWASMLRACYCGKVGGVWWGRRLDVTVRQTYRGIEFFDSDVLLATAELRHGVRVARDADAAVLALLKDVLSTGSTKPEYLAAARRALRERKGHWLERLASHFDLPTARMFASFLREPKPERLPRVARRLRRALFASAWRTKPLAALLCRLRNLWDRCRRVIDRPGIVVAVLGADGSGKSAIIEAIKQPLQEALQSLVRSEHSRPNLLPSIARLLRRPVQEGVTANPRAGTPSGPLGSLARLAFHISDYVLGYWLKVFPALVRWPCVWIFDRYCYDLLIDPGRARIALLRWIIRLLLVPVPRPDVVLCLGGNHELIHRRKPELPLVEVSRQVAAFKQLCSRLPNAAWIDTTRPIEESTDAALRAVIHVMTARYARRR
jgi:thymidylate kinase